MQYATNGWSTWCLHLPEPSDRDPYIECKMKLFKLLSVLNSPRIKISDLDALEIELHDFMIEHASIFPFCEQTYALYDLVHVFGQIRQVGPPRNNSLFMYERVNKTCKGMIKNAAFPLPSIVKGYAVNICICI